MPEGSTPATQRRPAPLHAARRAHGARLDHGDPRGLRRTSRDPDHGPDHRSRAPTQAPTPTEAAADHRGNCTDRDPAASHRRPDDGRRRIAHRPRPRPPSQPRRRQ